MSFYSKFSTYYEQIFPFKQAKFSFLRGYVTANNPAVLDVGCGTGHFAGKFAESGAHAVGIDLDDQMIAYAKAHYPAATFSALNMVDVKALDQSFDLIFSVGNVVSHLPKTELAHFIKSIYSCLSDKGLWIFQTINWDFVLKHGGFDFPVINVDDGSVEFARKYRDLTAASLTFEISLRVDGNIIFYEQTPLYPIRSDDYISLHEAAGFKLAGHFGDYAKAAFEPDSKNANILVFQK